MQLSKVQERFKSLMLNHPDALKSIEVDFSSQFEEGRISLSRRMRVYRNNIVGSLTDVMIATFPLLEKLVGKDFLEGCARSFILQSPPSHGCLNFYGEGFDQFLETFEPARSLSYLPDIARLELALNQSYYAKDDFPLKARDLAAIPPDDLGTIHLELRGSVRFVKSDYPLLAIKAFCENGRDGTLDLDQGGDCLMIIRPDLDTEIAKLDDDEMMALKELQQGSPLGQAVHNTLDCFSAFDFQDFLQKHIVLETFKALEANENSKRA